MFDESKMYKITLTDGTVLSDLSVNGDNFISKTILDPNIFREDNLFGVFINDGEKNEVHDYMVALISGVNNETEFWFALFDAEYQEPDMTIPQLQADVEYIAMMTGVEL